MSKKLNRESQSAIRRAVALVALGVPLFIGSSAMAADGTWTATGDGIWSTSASTNWSAGVVASGIGAKARFDQVNITADRTITLGENVTIGSIDKIHDKASSYHKTTFDTGAYTLTFDVSSGWALLKSDRDNNVFNGSYAANDSLNFAVASSRTAQFNGTLSLGAGLTLHKIEGGTLQMNNAMPNLLGTVMVSNGSLNLNGDAGDSLAHVAGLNLVGGTLSLQGGLNDVDRLGTAPIKLGGGTLNFKDFKGVTAGAETAGAVELTTSHSVIRTESGIGSITFSSLTRSDRATVAFRDYSATKQVKFATAPTVTHGIMAPWASTWGNDWLTYDATNGIQTFASYGTGAETTWVADNTDPLNPVYVHAKPAANVIMTEDRMLYTLKADAGRTVDLGGKKLTLLDGGLIKGGSSAATISNGTLTAGDGTAPAELTVTVNNDSSSSGRDLFVGAVIADNNGQAVTLVKGGQGLLRLDAQPTHTGGTYINSGKFAINANMTLEDLHLSPAVSSFVGNSYQLGLKGTFGWHILGNPSEGTVSGMTAILKGDTTFDIEQDLETARFDVYQRATLNLTLGSDDAALPTKYSVTKKGTGSLRITTADWAGTTIIEEGILNLHDVGSNFTTGALTIGAGDGSKNAGLYLGNGDSSSEKTYGNAIEVLAGSGARKFGSYYYKGNVLVKMTGAFNLGADLEIANSGSHIMTLAGPITGAGGITKTDGGKLVLDNANSTYSGDTVLKQGLLQAPQGLSPNTRLVFASSGIDGSQAVVMTSGQFKRTLGSGVRWESVGSAPASGGLAAYGGDLTVDLNGDGAQTLTWGDSYFVGNGGVLQLNYAHKENGSTNVITWTDHINLNGAEREINVGKNLTTQDLIDPETGLPVLDPVTLNPVQVPVYNDYAVVNGNLTNGGLLKSGNGKLVLNGAGTDLSSVRIIATYTNDGKTSGVGQLVLGAHMATAQKLSNLTIQQDSVTSLYTGVLDVTTNTLIIDNSDFATVEAMITQGAIMTSANSYNGKSAAMVHVPGTEPLLAQLNNTLRGKSFDDNSQIVRFTYLGDADLDGDVDASDVAKWALNFTGELSGGPTATKAWTQGDWDKDGDVDASDVAKWALNFTGELSGAGLVVDAPGASPAAVAMLQSMGMTVVPEPGSMLLFGAAAMTGLIARRRRF